MAQCLTAPSKECVHPFTDTETDVSCKECGTEIVVIGLGKLGLPMAAIYASKGYRVTAIDTNKDVINKLMAGECPISEPGLPELLESAWPNMTFIPSIPRFTDEMQPYLTFIIVPTPSDDDSKFSNRYIEAVLEKLKGLRMPVVVVSTVMPGSCRHLSEKYGLRIIYNPEFIAIGDVIQGMLHPDSMLIGHQFGDYPNSLIEFHKTIVGPNVPMHVMSWENAELAKLALNCYVTTKITFANQIAEICEHMRGGNVDQITAFLGSDSRIGKKYLKGGLGFGGPCFPRDNEAFIANKGFALQRAVIGYNNSMPIKLLRKSLEMVHDIRSPRVVILGTAYKTNTLMTERSQAYLLLQDLKDERKDIQVWGEDNPKVFSISGADLAIICLDYPEFHRLDLSVMRHKRVLDCWRILENKDECELYRAIGVGV